jgi:hypothetical protein
MLLTAAPPKMKNNTTGNNNLLFILVSTPSQLKLNFRNLARLLNNHFSIRPPIHFFTQLNCPFSSTRNWIQSLDEAALKRQPTLD